MGDPVNPKVGDRYLVGVENTHATWKGHMTGTVTLTEGGAVLHHKLTEGTALSGQLPPHMELSIEHNPHFSVHETVEQWITSHWEDRTEDCVDYDEMVRLNEIWWVHWYPKTAIGFYTVGASTLEKALAAAMEASK